MSPSSSFLSSNLNSGSCGFVSVVDCPFSDGGLLDTEFLKNVQFDGISLQGLWSEHGILGSGVWGPAMDFNEAQHRALSVHLYTDTDPARHTSSHEIGGRANIYRYAWRPAGAANDTERDGHRRPVRSQTIDAPDTLDLAQPTDFIAPLRATYMNTGLYQQARVNFPDEQAQITPYADASTVPSWTLFDSANNFATFIAACQTQFPELAIAMKEIKRAQKVTRQNEYIAYACFWFHKDYKMVARGFSVLFYNMSEGGSRMRFRRMVMKKGFSELLRLSREIMHSKRGTRVI